MVYFDAQENLNNELHFDFCSAELYTVYALANTKASDIVQSYAIPTVSTDSSLELLKVQELEANMAMNNYHPIIIDTGASLAITGNKQDFIPNTYQEVTSLKLGGMEARAKIDGVGNVAWSFPCENGDQMVIVTKCYYVPTARTRLLSPQRIFDKQNGHQGRYWGDEDTFVLEYKEKPKITIEYAPESNLPIAYAMKTPGQLNNQVDFSLLDEQNQNLTAGQKLLLEYHYRFGHTNMPLVQQILRSEGFAAGKFAAASSCEIPKC